MAAPVLLTDDDVCFSPLLIRKQTYTAGATATEFAHGGPASTRPDLMIPVVSATNPTASEVAVYASASDLNKFTLDCEAASGTITVYHIWVNKARQDGQSINSDNNA